MNYTVTTTENYSLIKLGADALGPDNIDNLKTECVKWLKNSAYLIFNCKALAGFDKDQKNLFVSIEALAKKGGGSIILTELSDDAADKMEEAGINVVPTDDEAVDFIFMEQIESQFLDDDEEEEETDY